MSPPSVAEKINMPTDNQSTELTIPRPHIAMLIFIKPQIKACATPPRTAKPHKLARNTPFECLLKIN
jgi:hypothetical protein